MDEDVREKRLKIGKSRMQEFASGEKRPSISGVKSRSPP